MNLCEESSICSTFQSAICFHCNRRLCLVHITEHSQSISQLNNLFNQIKVTYEQIHEESNKRKDIFSSIVSSLNQWRADQMEKIEVIYQTHFEMIESQRESLSKAEMKLFEELEDHARQPLVHLQREGDVRKELIHHIEQTNKRIREENKYLKWKFARRIPPSVTPSTPPSIPVNSKTRSNNQKSGRALKRLVRLFGNIKPISQAKKNILLYIKKLASQFHLPVVICSYLTAWHQKSNIDEKVYLLQEHMNTIEKYLKKRRSNVDVLIGIQVFFYNQSIVEDKSEMMTFLLQFFLNYGCVNREEILHWYERDVHGYKGFILAKQLATPFMKSFSAVHTVENEIPPTSIDQVKIKEEAIGEE